MVKTLWLWSVYTLFVVYATTLPFHFEPLPSTAATRKLAHLTLNPLLSPSGGRASITDMTQNVLLFVPFGALGMLTFAPWRRRATARSRSRSRRGRRTAAALMAVTLLGTTASVGVEVLQLFTTDRISSLNDVLTNTIGAAIGGLVMLPLVHVVRRMAELIGSLPQRVRVPFQATIVAAAVLGVAAWHPFDVSLDVGAFFSKLRTFVTDPWQAGAGGDEGVDFLRYALFGGAAAVWLRATGLRLPRTAAALIASSAAIALELSQLFIGARMPGLKDMLIGVVGGSAGAAIGPYASAVATPVIPVLLVVSAWLAAAVMELTPFTLAPERSPIGLVPFLTYYQYTSGQTVSHVLELVLAFFPIGFVLARWSDGVPRWPRIVGVALVLATLLEYLQGWIVGRYPDITDVMVFTLGAVVGALTARAALTPEITWEDTPPRRIRMPNAERRTP